MGTEICPIMEFDSPPPYVAKLYSKPMKFQQAYIQNFGETRTFSRIAFY